MKVNKVFIIAEAGVNHNGSIELAKRLIDIAALAKVDAVKFQSFRAENLVCKDTEKAEYQKVNTGNKESQYEMIKKLELNQEAHRILMDYCKEKNILFLSSPFDLESIDLLDQLGMPIFKIPSGEITNLPYLEKIGKLRKHVILSTGMSTMVEIKEAIEVLKKNGTTHIQVLHCNTDYPTTMSEVNLKAMLDIKEKLQVEVGYSDHTVGIEIPIAAVALGARVIEKHFTLDHSMEGPDHKASLELNELKMMVQAIRHVEIALGDGEKKPTLSELKNREVARKSIVAAKGIKKGEVFTENNITIKRPGTGISGMSWYEVLGRKAKKDYIEDELIFL